MTINGAFVAKAAIFSSSAGGTALESGSPAVTVARSRRAQPTRSSCSPSSSSSSTFFHLHGAKLKRSGYYHGSVDLWTAASSKLARRSKSGTPVCTMASTVVSKQAKDRGNWNKSLSILREFQSVCSTPAESLWSLVDEMVAEMEAGLAKEGGGKMRMLLTFVDNLPDGNEAGIFYALDLGGTNFRVLRVELGGKEGGVVRKESREAAIPLELMQGTNQELFDYIAKELASFACTSDESFRSRGKSLQLGFTFSFPIHQTSINSGNLINWTKGFAVPDTVGKDVVKELEAAIVRQGLHMRVSALVNDTVGTLARGHFVDEDVMVSVILGTGTNACYVEDAAAIPKWKNGRGKGFMVINTEWGSSWSDNLPRADVDESLDAESINPGDQFFEKMVSGMYLGDILRRILLKMATEAQLFGDEVPEKLKAPHTLTTPKMCAMHHDESSDLHKVGTILLESIGVETSVEVRQLVVDVCEAVVMRAARLAGAGIVGILKKIGRDGRKGENGSASSAAPRTVVAVDGGLYEKYPHFQDHLQKVVVEMLGEETARQVSIELSQDGSGVGAALIAACCPSSPSL